MPRLHRMIVAGALALGLAATALAAPPPWAPAHGYRYRNLDGLELVYDARLGVWEVLAIAGLYYLEGRYWRRVHDHWEWSDRPDGAWRAAARGREPEPLRGLGRPSAGASRADREPGAQGGRAHPPTGGPGHDRGAR